MMVGNPRRLAFRPFTTNSVHLQASPLCKSETDLQFLTSVGLVPTEFLILSQFSIVQTAEDFVRYCSDPCSQCLVRMTVQRNLRRLFGFCHYV